MFLPRTRQTPACAEVTKVHALGTVTSFCEEADPQPSQEMLVAAYNQSLTRPAMPNAPTGSLKTKGKKTAKFLWRILVAYPLRLFLASTEAQWIVACDPSGIGLTLTIGAVPMLYFLDKFNMKVWSWLTRPWRWLGRLMFDFSFDFVKVSIKVCIWTAWLSWKCILLIAVLRNWFWRSLIRWVELTEIKLARCFARFLRKAAKLSWHFHTSCVGLVHPALMLLLPDFGRVRIRRRQPLPDIAPSSNLDIVSWLESTGDLAEASAPDARDFEQPPAPATPNPIPLPEANREIQDSREAPSPAQLAHILLNHRDPDGYLLPIGKPAPRKVDYGRAKPLVKDMKNDKLAFTRQLASRSDEVRELVKAWDSTIDVMSKFDDGRRVNFFVIAGWNGCGKTFPMVDFLRKHPAILSDCKISCPTTRLRDDWVTDLALPESERYRVGTYETNLRKTAGFWIVDEAARNPPGYVELGLMADPAIHTVLLLFDHLQLDHTVPADPDLSHRALRPEADYYKRYIKYYMLWTRRGCQVVAKQWVVPCMSKEVGFIITDAVRPHGGAPAYRVYMKNSDVALAGTVHARSFGAASVQGLTWRDPMNIHVDKALVEHADAKMLAMLMHRSTKGVVFVNGAQTIPALKNSVLDRIRQGLPTPVEEIFKEELRSLTVIKSPLTIRA